MSPNHFTRMGVSLALGALPKALLCGVLNSCSELLGTAGLNSPGDRGQVCRSKERCCQSYHKVCVWVGGCVCVGCGWVGVCVGCGRVGGCGVSVWVGVFVGGV